MDKYDKEEDKLSRRIEIENILDSGYGSGILKHPEAAKVVIDNWNYFDKKRYDLCAYVVMPNHVHLLIKTNSKFTVGELVKSWKRFTAKAIRRLFAERKNADYQSALPDEANKILMQGKPFWQREYWDRFIRDENHYLKSIDYIHNNPVKAGLCKISSEWQWSSQSNT
jgi:REP element-mobilizing transposase RayT